MQVGYLTGVVTVAVVESLCLVLRMAGNSWEENKKEKKSQQARKTTTSASPFVQNCETAFHLPTYLLCRVRLLTPGIV